MHLRLALVFSLLLLLPGIARAAEPPAVGAKAPDFTLPALNGGTITLSQELQNGPVVLVLLRGWPGYQCPFCVRQYGDFIRHRAELEASGARVLWVYPAQADAKKHAEEMIAGLEVPPNFRLTIDPDYTFTNLYGLRWSGEGETTYPSTFVIDRSGTVRWSLISRTHGGRAMAADVLAELAGMEREK